MPTRDVRMTATGGTHPNAHLIATRVVQIQGLKGQRGPGSAHDCSFDLPLYDSWGAIARRMVTHCVSVKASRFEVAPPRRDPDPDAPTPPNEAAASSLTVENSSGRYISATARTENAVSSAVIFPAQPEQILKGLSKLWTSLGREEKQQGQPTVLRACAMKSCTGPIWTFRNAASPRCSLRADIRRAQRSQRYAAYVNDVLAPDGFDQVQGRFCALAPDAF